MVQPEVRFWKSWSNRLLFPHLTQSYADRIAFFVNSPSLRIFGKFENACVSMSEKVEEFSNRWGIVLASLGMAIGAGNLWRFPRLAGQYGGAFIILWIFFLLVWSIPLLMAELSIGKKFKKGTIGSFGSLVGKNFTWMGFFITLCTLGIAFYYSVVTGWAFRYFSFTVQNFFSSVTGGTTLAEKLTNDPTYMDNFWQNTANAHPSTITFYIICVILGVIVIHRGIQNGLEKVNRILIPTLFVLLFVVAGYALTMKNGVKGLEYMFSIKMEHFSNPTIWIEALSQSAWSTGAGWGLMMTIGAFSRSKEDVTLNTFLGAFGNNTASLVAGMAVLPSVFALATSEAQATEFLKAGSQALTFTIIPQLFANIPGGAFFSMVFFGAFFLAAFSSLLPMLQLLIKNITDLSISKKNAAIIAIVCCVIMGFPSAYSLHIFENQDWVWGIGLIITGFFVAFGVAKYGPGKFKKDFIDTDSDFLVPVSYFKIAIYAVLVLGVFLVYWWMSQGYSANPWFDEQGNWNVFDVYSNASIVTQWGIVILIGLIFNKWIYKKFVTKQ